MLNNPGQYPGISANPRQCLVSEAGVIRGRGVIDSTLACDGGNTGFEDELREGCPLARVTASATWVPCKRTTANGAGTGSTTLVVVNAAAFKVGDQVSINGGALVAITAINYGTNTLTLASAETWTSGQAVNTTDGSQICRGILNQFVKLKDLDGIWRDKPFGDLLIAGLVDPNKCLGDLAAIRGDTGNMLQQIQFADSAGQV